MSEISTIFTQEIKEFIKSFYPGEILVNTTKISQQYPANIVIPSKKIAIGFSELELSCEKAVGNVYHLNKLKAYNQKGYFIIQVFEHEWVKIPEVVKGRIRHILHKTKKHIYARNTFVKEISAKQARDFINQTHVQQFTGASTYLGLFDKNQQLIGCMTFGKSRYNKNIGWELLRYSTKLDISVIGGASKIFDFFVKNYQPNMVVSYADKRWSYGNMYYCLGFTPLKDSRPNYYYFQPEFDKYKLYHRSHFQKHKLPRLLTYFDPSLTEYQNMIINGYDRIWDCGNKVFVWQQKTTN